MCRFLPLARRLRVISAALSMGALYEVLSPSAQRGSRLDLGLQRMRHTAGVGRVHLVLTLAGESQPTVLKECVAPPDATLDGELAALGETLSRVTDRAFVRVAGRAITAPPARGR